MGAYSVQVVITFATSVPVILLLNGFSQVNASSGELMQKCVIRFTNSIYFSFSVKIPSW